MCCTAGAWRQSPRGTPPTAQSQQPRCWLQRMPSTRNGLRPSERSTWATLAKQPHQKRCAANTRNVPRAGVTSFPLLPLLTHQEDSVSHRLPPGQRAALSGQDRCLSIFCAPGQERPLSIYAPLSKRPAPGQGRQRKSRQPPPIRPAPGRQAGQNPEQPLSIRRAPGRGRRRKPRTRARPRRPPPGPSPEHVRP
jgi:hypothetical protein